MLLAAAGFLKVMARTGRGRKEMHISAGFLFAGRSLQPDEMRYRIHIKKRNKP